MRTSGYQATQWAVTVPIEVPSGATPLATDPLTLAPLFVIDTAGATEVLHRVATVRDYEEVPQAELRYFDVRTPSAQAWFDNAREGDILRIPSGPAHWLQPQAPYTDHDFIISGQSVRASGINPRTLSGAQLILPGYTFSEADIGRWVRLTGFTSTSYNGLLQIVSYLGNVAQVSKTFSGAETGATWQFDQVAIKQDPLGEGYEPRYFPTRARNLPWQLRRGSSLIAAGAGGGVTARGQTDRFVRSVRFTSLAPTLADGRAMFDYVAAELARLRLALDSNDSAFTPLLTITEST